MVLAGRLSFRGLRGRLLHPALPGKVCVLFLFIMCFPAQTTAQSGPPNEGSGSGWADLDNDGDLDFIDFDENGVVRVFRCKAGFHYEDVTSSSVPAGILLSMTAGMGVATGDVNNDGFVDVFLTTQGLNILLLNKGDWTFGVTKVGITGSVFTASAAFIDYNNDSLLDIYVANYADYANQFFRNDGLDENGIPHFTDVAPEMKMDFGYRGQSNFCLGLAVADYDNDGDTDIYIANDYGGIDNSTGELLPGVNILFRNNGDHTFTDVTFEAGAGDAGWAMGVHFGDYNRDGWLDIFLTNFWEDALLRNNQDGTFTNVTREVGLISDEPDEWHFNGWGTNFFDFDNDGDLDIHVTNGYILNGVGQIFNEPNQLWENLGPINAGKYLFKEIGLRAGIADEGDGRGAAYGDFNQDGLLDFSVSHNRTLTGGGIVQGAPVLIFVNQGDGTFVDQALALGIRDEFPDGMTQPGFGDYTSNHWLQIKLEGTLSNRSAIGSRVKIQAAGSSWIQDVGASSYCSENSPYLHFGLGSHETVNVSVEFPSGAKISLFDIATDQLLTLVEPTQVPVRLLSFEVISESYGVRVSWSYVDEGDLVDFAVHRRDESTEMTWSIRGDDGRGELMDRGVTRGSEVEYRLYARYRDGSQELLRTASLRFEPVSTATLSQNFPNPFRSRTLIRVPESPEGKPGRIDIFDISGRLIRSLAAEDNAVIWDGRDVSGTLVPAGAYFYRLTGSQTALRMIRLP